MAARKNFNRENLAHVSDSDLRALSDRIERMREEERTRIARELHDELGQLLTGIKLDFSSALRRLRDLKVPGDVVDRLQSAVGQIDIGITVVRRIASDLRPASLDHHDLGGAIEFEARRRTAQSGIRIEVSHDLQRPLDAAMATGAFRIFQEALTNAIRHAEASDIRVQMTTIDETLVLIVTDNGVGMPSDIDGREPALGLMGMRERAHALGGHVSYASPHGRGTQVTMTLPLGAEVSRT